MTEKFINFDDVVIGDNYSIRFWFMTKTEAVNRKEFLTLVKKGENIKKRHYNDGK